MVCETECELAAGLMDWLWAMLLVLSSALRLLSALLMGPRSGSQLAEQSDLRAASDIACW